MASFEIADKKTAKSEGGYTCHPADNGNWTSGNAGQGDLIGTKYGISAPLLMAFLNRKPTIREMQNLSPETAKQIRKTLFWDKIRGDEWQNQANADNVYDMAINSGVQAAITLWQITIGMKPVTGKMNEQTLKATNLKT